VSARDGRSAEAPRLGRIVQNFIFTCGSCTWRSDGRDRSRRASALDGCFGAPQARRCGCGPSSCCPPRHLRPVRHRQAFADESAVGLQLCDSATARNHAAWAAIKRFEDELHISGQVLQFFLVVAFLFRPMILTCPTTMAPAVSAAVTRMPVELALFRPVSTAARSRCARALARLDLSERCSDSKPPCSRRNGHSRRWCLTGNACCSCAAAVAWQSVRLAKQHARAGGSAHDTWRLCRRKAVVLGLCESVHGSVDDLM